MELQMPTFGRESFPMIGLSDSVSETVVFGLITKIFIGDPMS
jgi:hypothetical protein